MQKTQSTTEEKGETSRVKWDTIGFKRVTQGLNKHPPQGNDTVWVEAPTCLWATTK